MKYEPNEVEAFEAMYRFLKTHHARAKSDDLQTVLLDLSHPLPLGEDAPTTLTPGYWEDWLAAVEVARVALREARR